MPVLGFISYDTTKIDDSDSSTGGVITKLKPYSVYRNLKFYSPTTGDLNTWLQGNAVKMPLTGTYVFNSTPTAPSSDVDSREISSSTNVSILFPDYTGSDPLLLTRIEASSDGTISFETYVNGEPNLVGAYSNGTWEDSSLRTITFTQPVQYEGNEEFVRWFVDNATPLPDITPGNYQFNLTLTSMPFAKDTDVPINFKCFFGGKR